MRKLFKVTGWVTVLLLSTVPVAGCDSDCANDTCLESTQGIATTGLTKVRIESQTVGGPIASDFLGLSFEYEAVRAYMEINAPSISEYDVTNPPPDPSVFKFAPNPQLIALLKNIGDGAFRIGGDSSQGFGRFTAPVGYDELEAVALVSEAAHWKAFIGVPEFIARPRNEWSNDETVRLHARRIASFSQTAFAAHPSDLIGIEIGNEPHWGGPGTPDATTVPYEEWQNNFEDEMAGLRAGDPFQNLAGLSPSVGFLGPTSFVIDETADGTNPKAIASFVKNVPAVKMITFHRYNFSNNNADDNLEKCGHVEDPSTPAHDEASAIGRIRCMLSLDAALRDRSNFSFVSGLARNRTVVLGETAVGLARGGPQLVGVADSAASMLWALDYIFNGLESGVDRFNFHTLYRADVDPSPSDTIYNAFTIPDAKGNLTPRPLYYAMLAASLARSGTRRQVTHLSDTSKNLQVHAVAEADGQHVLVYAINKSEVATELQIEADNFKQAGAFVLGGSSLTATGSNAVAIDGHYVDATTPYVAPVFNAITANNGIYDLTVPVGKAIVVRLGSDANPSAGGSDADASVVDSCVGRVDGIYCSVLATYSAIQCKNGSIAGGYQCPEPQTCIGPNGPGSEIECK